MFDLRHPVHRFLLVLVIASSAPLLPGQMPPGGYPLDESYVDKPFTFSDGVITLIDVRHPKAPAQPPTNGWPVILCSHGRGGTRGGVLGIAKSMAKRGYLTISMDHRPYGRTALPPNNPSTMDSSAERRILDWVELLHQMEAKYTTLLDEQKVGAAGISMGGYLSSFLAAYSGKTLPLSSTWPNVPKTGPKLMAISIRISAIDTGAFYITENGDLLSSEFARVLSEDRKSPAWLLAQGGSYQLLRQNVERAPLNFPSKLLRANPTVPIQMQAGWDDYIPPVDVCADILESLTVPRMGLLSLPGHGTPGNDVDRDWNSDLMGLWFDHFMQGSINGVDLRPRFEASVTPHDETVYTTPALPAAHRFSASWPPATPVQQLHLRGDNTLTAAPPTGVETSATIVHSLPAGYDLAKYISEGGGQSAAAVTIPLSVTEFVGSQLTVATELFGRPKFTATISIDQPHYQLSVSLWSRDASNKDRYISMGTAGKNLTTPGNHSVAFDMQSVAMVVPQGNRLVVKLHNLALFLPPAQNRITWVPDLRGSVTTTVKISSAAPAVLHLPVAAARGVDFTPRYAERSASAGFSHPLRVAAGAHRSGRPYVIGFGLSGIAPPMTFLGQLVWLRPDALTSLLYIPGTLDTSGQALQVLALPPTPAAAGLRVAMVALVVEGASVVPSVPTELDIGL